MYCRITKGRSANYLVIVQGYRNERVTKTKDHMQSR